MSEQKIPIPAMLYNSAVGGHVTNSQQIIDENLNREQNDINQETVGAVPYNSTTPNGMGRIVLKKNDNFKEVVEAQTNGNTIFVIKYDFTLTDNVTIPANCILQFDGGSIRGEFTLTGTKTGLSGVQYNIFDINISINGTFSISYFTPEMFISESSNDAIIINRAINAAVNTLVSSVILLPKIYNISTSINITDGIYLGGLNPGTTYEYYVGTPKIKATQNISMISVTRSPIQSHGGISDGIRIANLQLYGNGKNNGMVGINVDDVRYFGEELIENVFIKDCRYGIHISNAIGIYSNFFRKLKLYECVIGMYVEGKVSGSTKETWMNDNVFENIAFYTMDICGIYLKNMTSIQINTFINCTFESFGTISNIADYNNFGGVSAVRFDGGSNVNQFISCYFEGYTAKYNDELIEGYLDNEKNSIFIVENGAGVSVENCIISSFINIYYCYSFGSVITKHNYYGTYRGEGKTGLLILKNPAYSKYCCFIFDEDSSSLLNESIAKAIKSVNQDGIELQPYQYKNINIIAKIAPYVSTGDVGQVENTDRTIIQEPSVGPTNCRPSAKITRIGKQYFDTTIGKPIYAKEIVDNTVTWVDATGATV